MPKASVIPPLILISLLWGIMLNGFFLYLPYIAEVEASEDTELIAGIGWLLFSMIAVGVGRTYSGPVHRKGARLLVGAVVAVLFLAVVVLGEAMGPWSWLLVSIPLSITLSLHISRLVSQSEPTDIARLSAWLGAAPLLGLLVLSAAFSVEAVRESYPVIALVIVGLALAAALIETRRGVDSSEGQHPTRVTRGALLAYGFLLGLGVALVNSYVFERIAEVTRGDSDEVASLGSLLIFLSSLVGVAASLLAGTQLVQRIPRVMLARLAAITISLGVVILLLATNIPLVALAGLLVGVGFGFTNGVELRLVHAASLDPALRTALFGQFLAATTIPYVVASIIGLQLRLFAPGTTPVLLVSLVAVTLGALMLRTREADPMRATSGG